MPADSIFTKIIKGEIPAYKVYEDDRTLAFLDIHPATPGHTLVIPKVQVDHLWQLDDVDYQAVMATAKKVALRLQQVLSPKRVGCKVEGVGVPHAHVHVFAFSNAEEFDRRPDQHTEPDFQALQSMAEKLAF